MHLLVPGKLISKCVLVPSAVSKVSETRQTRKHVPYLVSDMSRCLLLFRERRQGLDHRLGTLVPSSLVPSSSSLEPISGWL